MLAASVLQVALLQLLQQQIKSFDKSVKRRVRLLQAATAATGPLGAPKGPQQQLAEAVKQSPPLSVLCSGGCALLPLLALQAAALAYYCAAELREVRLCGTPLPLKLFAAEPLTGAFEVMKKLLLCNAEVRLYNPQC